MPTTTREPVLTVDETRIGSFDPQNPGDLSTLWQGTRSTLLTLPNKSSTNCSPFYTAFSKTSLIDQGERLKNLSWRLWTRETLCGTAQRRKRPSVAPPFHHPSNLSIPATVPELSSSLESSSSTETQDEMSDSVESVIGQSIPSENVFKERHITPNDLRNLIHSIKQPHYFKPLTSKPLKTPKKCLAAHSVESPPDLPPKSASRHPTTESSTSTVATTTDSFASTSKKSDTSVSSTGSTHSIIRGFTPGTSGVTSYRSTIQLEPPVPSQPTLKKPSIDHAAIPKKKGPSVFYLGCSSGSGASAEEDDLMKENSPAIDSRQRSNASKKQTSFKEEVSVMQAANPAHQDEAVFDSDDEDSEEDDEEEEDEEDGEISESAIEDDDDAWEDEGSEAQEAEQEKEMKFYRVDSRANLPTHRSLLTLNLEGQRNASKKGVISPPVFRRSRASTPNGPSMPGSPEEDPQLEQRIEQMQTSQPIIRNGANVQTTAPLTSPRTTRRNMLAGELSESLRKNMLSERQQKNPLRIDSNNIRRTQTAQDVSRLTRLPEHVEHHNSYDQPALPHRNNGNGVSWNHFFDHSIGELNQAGW